MTTSTSTPTAPAEGLPEVANLRETRRAQAAARQAHPAGKKAPAKAPAKKAAAKKAAGPALEKQAFVATSRSGKTSTRMCMFVATHAVDVADPDAKTEAGRKGLIWGFFANREQAEKAAERATAAGHNAIVTKAVKA